MIRWAFILFVCLTGGSSLLGQVVPGTCDLILHKGHVYVEAQFEQIDQPVLFLFDTGTDHFIINNDLIQALELTSLDPLAFSVGSIQFHIPFVPPSDNGQSDSLKRLRLGPLLEGKLYGGILGNRAYNDQYVIIDYPALKFTVKNPSQSLPEALRSSPFAYQNDQVFVEVVLSKRPAGYFHLDTGIPDETLMEYRKARRLGVDDLGTIPNDSSKIVYDYTYDEDGEPTGRTQRTFAFSNHQDLASCQYFKVGVMDLGAQRIRTNNISLEEAIFADVDLKPINGSMTYETLKPFRIHLHFPTRKIAFEAP